MHRINLPGQNNFSFYVIRMLVDSYMLYYRKMSQIMHVLTSMLDNEKFRTCFQ